MNLWTVEGMRRNQPLFVQAADLYKNTSKMFEPTEQGKVRNTCEFLLSLLIV